MYNNDNIIIIIYDRMKFIVDLFRYPQYRHGGDLYSIVGRYSATRDRATTDRFEYLFIDFCKSFMQRFKKSV